MKDLTRYASAEPTETMEAFADFLEAKVFGGTLPEGFDRESFRKGVALGGSTRGYFQASDEWKADPRNYLANVETNRAAKIAEAKARAEATKAKADARLAALEAKLADAVAAAKAKAEALAETESAEISEAIREAASSVDAIETPEVETPEVETPEVETPESDETPSEAAERRDGYGKPTPPRRSRRAA